MNEELREAVVETAKAHRLVSLEWAKCAATGPNDEFAERFRTTMLAHIDAVDRLLAAEPRSEPESEGGKLVEFVKRCAQQG